MLDQLKTGSSREDILAAFKTVAGGPYITTERITTVFARDDYAQYILYTLEINPHNLEAKRRMHILRMRKKRERITLTKIGNKFKGLLSKNSKKK